VCGARSPQTLDDCDGRMSCSEVKGGGGAALEQPLLSMAHPIVLLRVPGARSNHPTRPDWLQLSTAADTCCCGC